MAPDTTPLNPYVGPRPYQRDEQHLFFARGRELGRVISGIIANRTFLLYAASGTGKTSLVNAGVIRALTEEGFDVLPPARVRGLSAEPSSDRIPNVYATNVLMNWQSDVTEMRRSPQVLREIIAKNAESRRGPIRSAASEIDPRALSSMTLSCYLQQQQRTIDDEGPLSRVIIFDQFEELFALYQQSWQQRPAFINQISEALRDDEFLRVLFVLREDYLAHFDTLAPGLPDAVAARFRLEGLSPQQALAAVIEPLKQTNRSFADGIAGQLVDDLLRVRIDTGRGETDEIRGQFVEPVQLQVVCQSLWSQLPPDVKVITKEHMRGFGDVDQVLSCFYSDAVRAAAASVEMPERDLRRWFEETFITSMGTRNTVYRAADTTAGIQNKAIDVLEDRHLIRAEWRSGARWYELVHDRLIEPVRASNRQLAGEGAQERHKAPMDAGNDALARAEAAIWVYRTDEARHLAKRARGIFRSIRHRPGEASALVAEGNAHARDNDLDAARGSYRAALKILEALRDGANQATVLSSIGLAYERDGNSRQAIVYYRRALQRFERLHDNPSRAHLLTSLGRAYHDIGRRSLAAESYERAVAIQRQLGDRLGMANNLVSIAHLRNQLGKPAAAVRAAMEGSRIYREVGERSGAAMAAVCLGMIAKDRARYAVAVRWFTEAIDVGSEDPYAYLERASAYWSSGRLQEAIDDYTRAIERRPDETTAYLNRGQVLADAGRFAEAISDLDYAIGRGLTRITAAYARSARGLACGGLQRYDEALPDLEAALKVVPHGAWIHLNRGLTYERMGKREEALADFQRALRKRRPPLLKWQTALAREGIRRCRAAAEAAARSARAGVPGSRRRSDPRPGQRDPTGSSDSGPSDPPIG